MLFKEWLKWACENRGKGHDEQHQKLLPELKLRDGTELSVQASKFHMCSPEETSNDGDIYESVEVYTHGMEVEGFNRFDETSPFTFGRISIKRMELICKNHGGIIVPE